MTSQPTITQSPLDQAVTEGLDYAAHLVDHFGWMPPGPDCGVLGLETTLSLAACKAARLHGQTVYDTHAVMAYRLSSSIGGDLIEWQDVDGLSADHVAMALRTAAAPA